MTPHAHYPCRGRRQQSGVVTETQFLIGLRVLCGLLRNFESFLPDEARIMRVSNFCASALPPLGTGGRFSTSKASRERRDRSNIAVARSLSMPRRIAQERVPTASNVGSRDVTWASQPTPLTPFRVFSRVSRAPFPSLLRQSGVVTETQILIGLRVLCGLLRNFESFLPDEARIMRVSNFCAKFSSVPSEA